jgi:type IV pilus assembly protein PilZ
VSDNRRKRGERLPVEVKVDYRTVGSFITDYTKNISRGGVFIRTSLPLEVGEKIRLRITLPDGDAPFALDGIVKWVSTIRDKDKHPPGMGVEFTNFTDEVQAQIDRLIANHPGDETT